VKLKYLAHGVSLGDELPLFTQLPRAFILGKWASGV
jgi:hypothetical protein